MVSLVGLSKLFLAIKASRPAPDTARNASAWRHYGYSTRQASRVGYHRLLVDLKASIRLNGPTSVDHRRFKPDYPIDDRMASNFVSMVLVASDI